MSFSAAFSKLVTVQKALGRPVKYDPNKVGVGKGFNRKKELKTCRRCDGTCTEKDSSENCHQCGGRGTEKI